LQDISKNHKMKKFIKKLFLFLNREKTVKKERITHIVLEQPPPF